MLPVKTRRLLYLFLLSSIINSCEPSSKRADCSAIMQKARKDGSSVKKPVCIVLCDFSSSMEPVSVERVQSEALKVFDQKFDQADLKFYQVTTSSQGPFFNASMIVLNDSVLGSERNRVTVKACLESDKKVMEDSLRNALQVASGSKSPETYLIQSLETAIDFINQSDPEHAHAHMVYLLSDMLESGTSSFGTIDLEHQRFEDIIKKVDNRADHSETYSNMAGNVTVKVVLLSGKVANRSQLIIFWNSVFKKLGYKDKVIFGSEATF